MGRIPPAFTPLGDQHKEGEEMQTDLYRTSTLPSALVLGGLCLDGAGEPPYEELRQAGFDRSHVDGYLQRRGARTANCESRDRQART
jgi:hypothetical protein